LSRSEASTFDAWAAEEFARTGGFTALVVLLDIAELSVTPLRSTWFHVIGGELDWVGVAGMLDAAGADWHGALFAPRTAIGGGPLPDASARIHLQDLGQQVIEDRTVLNEEHFFDRQGRRMQVEEVRPQ
jgi:hypothetical protein